VITKLSHVANFYTVVLCQDEDAEGFNTSDEEFERQLEEAAMMEEQEKVEKARKPKVKKGRGRNARKKAKKVNNSSVGETEGDGYEVCCS